MINSIVISTMWPLSYSTQMSDEWFMIDTNLTNSPTFSPWSSIGGGGGGGWHISLHDVHRVQAGAVPITFIINIQVIKVYFVINGVLGADLPTDAPGNRKN